MDCRDQSWKMFLEEHSQSPEMGCVWGLDLVGVCGQQGVQAFESIQWIAIQELGIFGLEGIQGFS